MWEVLFDIGVLNPAYFASPSNIVLSMVHLTFHGNLIVDSGFTLIRVLIGLFIAIIVAIPLGFLLGGFFKNLEYSINPMIRLLEQFNPLTVFHIVILFTLINELSTIIVIYLAAQWPILSNTISGAKNVKPVYIKIAKAAMLDKFDIFWKIQLRSSLPRIFTGLRLGVTFGFLMAFGVEMMGMTTGRGLGYFILHTQESTSSTDIPYIWAGIVTMTLIAIALNYIITLIENHTVKEKIRHNTIY
ncbi:MAG: ABC transporter permease subunit [Methanobrevibacter sp.]|nr:ABC transporter permease subunit [Methanobrevibacter sp.]